MQDVLVVGQGPAGCSAALYLCRAGRSVTLIGKDDGALSRAERIENYYGLSQVPSGPDLLQAGRAQCQALGATLRTDEVLSVELTEQGRYEVTCRDAGVLESRAVLLSTGSSKHTPNIPGLEDLTGRGVSFCAVCDAFLYRNRSVAVLGAGAYALHELEVLLPLANEITLLTNGTELEFLVPERVSVRTEPIETLTGTARLETLVFSGGEALAVEGLFVALGSASASDLARKLGLPLNGDAIQVGAAQETLHPGLYAAGDCTGGMAQIAFAVAAGARAGIAICKFLSK